MSMHMISLKPKWAYRDCGGIQARVRNTPDKLFDWSTVSAADKQFIFDNDLSADEVSKVFKCNRRDVLLLKDTMRREAEGLIKERIKKDKELIAIEILMQLAKEINHAEHE